MNILIRPTTVLNTLERINLTECPLCGSESYDILINGNDFEFNTGEYRVQRCRSCLTSYTNPVIGEKDIYRFYAERNTPDFPNSTGVIQTLRQWYLAQQARRIINQMTLSKPISIMDYGCGDGAYSLALSTIPECKVCAVDFHEPPPSLLAKAIETSPNISYLSYQGLEKVDQVDVIFCRQVLEHIRDPQTLVAQLRYHLSPKGFLILEVPNFDSFWRKLLGKYYFPLHLPQHFYHFNMSSLTRLVEKEGFLVCQQSKLHAPALPKSIQYLAGIKMDNIGYLGLLSFPLSIVMDVLYGESTSIRLICQKV